MEGRSAKGGEKHDDKKKQSTRKSQRRSRSSSRKKNEEPKKMEGRRIVDKKTIEIIQDYIPRCEIYCDDPFTFAILFKTKDIPAIIEACDLLYEYINKNPEVGEEMVKKGVVEDLLSGPKDPYPYFNGARFRFLSKLYKMYPESRKAMEEDKEFIRMAAMDAVTTEDTPLRAYALLYCSWVTPNVPGIIKELIDKFGVNIYFRKFLCDPDIDVKHNSAWMLKNMLVFDWAAKRIIDCKWFSFINLVDMIGCPYPDIQNKALDVIYELTRRTEREQYVHQKFRLASGVDILFQLLNVFQWRDVHAKVLKVLRVLFRNFYNLERVQALKGVVRLINYASFILEEELITDDLKTILSLCQTYEGKLVMMKEDLLDLFIKILQHASQESKIQASQGIRVLAQETLGLRRLSVKDPSKMLLKIIHDEQNCLELRKSCACTLNELALSSPFAQRQLVRSRTFAKLVKLMEQPLVLPVDTICLVMETTSSVLSNALQVTKNLTFEFTENLIAILDNYEPEMKKLQQLAPELLAWTLERQVGRDWFVSLGGVTKVMKLLYYSSDPVLLNNLGLLLRMAIEKDVSLSEAFFRNGLVEWLMDNRKLWKESPRLETAAETIFTFDPSVKLEYWGRLETTDILTDGFYCSRYWGSYQFPLASDLVKEDVCPLRPVYMVFIGQDKPLTRADSVSLFHFGQKTDDYLTREKKESRMSVYSKNLLQLTRRQTIESLCDDVKLRDLYFDLKERIEALPSTPRTRVKKYCRQWVIDCAECIGITVANAMSGRHGERDCKYHTFELHIQELKLRLGTSLIPIGELEVGQKLERAVLFKALADPLGLPCALVRGLHAIAWVEVALPYGETEFYKDLPSEKMTTTHLVDLITEPGHLVRLDTKSAEIYCGMPVNGFLDHLPRHDPCKKPYWISFKNKPPEPIKRHVEIC